MQAAIDPAARSRIMPESKKDLVNTLLLAGFFMVFGLLILHQLIGDPAAIG